MQKNNFFSKATVILVSIFIFSACENLQRRSDINKSIQGGDSSVPVKDNQGETVKPTKHELKKPKVGIILGPGGINALAHLGVIKSLQEKKIPIDYIVGIEWGSLVGALYANNQQIHKSEWEVYKLKDKDLPSESYFSKKLEPVEVGQILSRFDWTNKSLDSSVQFSCPSQSIYQNQLKWQSRFKLKDRIKRCLSYPPAVTTKSGWISQPYSLKESIVYLKKQGAQLIIVSNVLTRKHLLKRQLVKENVASSILWYNLSSYYQDFLKLDNLKGLGYDDVRVVQVPFSGNHIYDYSNRKTLALKGFRATEPTAQNIVDDFGF